jgi:hypothetical protein
MPPGRVLAALAVCAIVSAACGSSPKPSTSGSADTQAVKYADCIRANGTPNFPDPGSNGRLTRCMRAHGLSHFPDPLTTYGPGLTLGRGEYFPDTSPGEVQSPAFRPAATACGLQLLARLAANSTPPL